LSLTEEAYNVIVEFGEIAGDNSGDGDTVKMMSLKKIRLEMVLPLVIAMKTQQLTMEILDAIMVMRRRVVLVELTMLELTMRVLELHWRTLMETHLWHFLVVREREFWRSITVAKFELL
jgi:hypothetical protein